MLNVHEIVWIDGPVGRMEAIYIPPKNTAIGVAVINHPNPLHGGDFTNKVSQTIAKALSEMGFYCYLPNFRGVGKSEGVHDYGRGEIEDCLAVIHFAQAMHTDVHKLALSGFSFGGYVALSAAERSSPDVLLPVGAAIGIYPQEAPKSASPAKTLLIHGEIDEVVPLKNVLNWAAPQQMPVLVIPEASHFFHGKLIILRDQIRRFLPTLLAAE